MLDGRLKRRMGCKADGEDETSATLIAPGKLKSQRQAKFKAQESPEPA